MGWGLDCGVFFQLRSWGRSLAGALSPGQIGWVLEWGEGTDYESFKG